MEPDWNRNRRGPVTLVVEKQDGEGSNLFSWTFGSVSDAMAEAHAFNDAVRWMVVKGSFRTARDAVQAAEQRVAVLVRSSSESGTFRRVSLGDVTVKQRSSA
jgi:hypothetical protein